MLRLCNYNRLKKYLLTKLIEALCASHQVKGTLR